MGRQSNIELLRIVTMFFILILHVNIKGLWGNIEEDFPLLNIGSNFAESFAVIAVNCFILISGYFQINFKISSITRLLFQCVFYNLLICIIYSICLGKFSIHTLIHETFVFSHWWFVKSYILLIIFSPILNSSIQTLERKVFFIVLVLLLVLRVNEFNFFLLYLLGGFIRRFYCVDLLSRFRIHFIGLYILISIISGVFLSYFRLNTPQYIPYIIGYNSLFVICSSVFFFLFFLTLKVKNTVINSVAVSVFAVYLVHEHHLVSPYFTNFIKSLILLSEKNQFILFLYLLVFVVLVFIISVLIDKGRLFLVNFLNEKILKPLLSYSQNRCSSLFMKIFF